MLFALYLFSPALSITPIAARYRRSRNRKEESALTLWPRSSTLNVVSVLSNIVYKSSLLPTRTAVVCMGCLESASAVLHMAFGDEAMVTRNAMRQAVSSGVSKARINR